MREQLQARFTELTRDYQLGQGRLAELDREQAALRETLLRINGAMQVIEELLGASNANGHSANGQRANGQRAEPEAGRAHENAVP